MPCIKASRATAFPKASRTACGAHSQELVERIHSDYGLSEMDAYELRSKVATIHVAEMVDPNYVVVAEIDKKFLPQRRW
jgi:acetamidase/formamidase